MFEKISKDYELKENEEIYFIDKNKIDIYKGSISKIKKNGSLVITLDDQFTEISTQTVGRNQIILRTEKNNEIYEKQSKEREKEKEKQEEKKIEEGEDNSKNESKSSVKSAEKKKSVIKKEKNENESNGQNKKAKKKAKKPIFDKQLIVKTAWGNGIHNPKKFKKFIEKNVKEIREEYDRYFKMMNIAEHPLFSIGGDIEQKSLPKFWTTAQSQWRKLFDDSETVPTGVFLKKAIKIFKLPHQTESNARETIGFFFDPAENEEISFFQFCAFLALFGPSSTVCRKISDLIKINPDVRNMFSFVDPTDFNNEDSDNEINCFNIPGPNEEFSVYNNPFVPFGEKYLIDQNGEQYSTWNEFLENHSIISESKGSKPKREKKIKKQMKNKTAKEKIENKEKDEKEEKEDETAPLNEPQIEENDKKETEENSPTNVIDNNSKKESIMNKEGEEDTPAISLSESSSIESSIEDINDADDKTAENDSEKENNIE